MVYSSSGVVEEGAVFATSFDVEATPGSRTCLLKIAVSPCGDQRSHVDVSCAYTALTSAGDPFLAPWTNEKFLTDVVFWERSMNHDLETGTQLIK